MKSRILDISIIAVSVLTSFIAYFYLPPIVASHWNYLGIVDAYSPKLFNLVIFPSLSILIYVLLEVIPKIDPMKSNITIFNAQFKQFITIFLIFFLLVQYQVLLWNLGLQIPFNIVFPVILGIFLFFIGQLLKNTKRNWSIGIRTPWTLSSDYVWDQTHKVGGNLFKLSLPIFFISILLPNYSFLIVIGYLLLVIIFLIIYSYIIFKKEKNS